MKHQTGLAVQPPLSWKVLAQEKGKPTEGVPMPRLLLNKIEAEFQRLASSKGWIITKRGWPDFLCITPDGVVAVECKPRFKRKGSLQLFQLLKREQAAVFDILESAGIPCFVSDGVDLECYTPAIHSNEKRRYSRQSVPNTPSPHLHQPYFVPHATIE